MTQNKPEFLKGAVDLLILKVVALGPIHGYAISHRIQQISKDYSQVQQGTLYPALRRLENRGRLAAEWRDADTGPGGEVLADEDPSVVGTQQRSTAPGTRSS